ncbi:hypothetical protein RHMOL_Rhmol03G0006500 [Rhododendron molle]|uniref:Uncharacterized protein n=1 Tax=Rhododendron molle TaxID=49168 RepID=A0ACC0P8U3_RHOML|nr:hypothetical protein RHMOL_Rhmol03G0006500 [Rhododendron molle]
MEAKIGKFFESVGSFFTGGDHIPWSDGDIVVGTANGIGGKLANMDILKRTFVSNGFWMVIIYFGCEREVAEAEQGSSDELKSECIMRLSWALVHSRRPEDVQRGIAMLEGEKLDV